MAHPTLQIVPGRDRGPAQGMDPNQIMAMMAALMGKGMDAKSAEKTARIHADAQLAAAQERSRSDVQVAGINAESGALQQRIQAQGLANVTKLQTEGAIARDAALAALKATSQKVAYDQEIVGKALDRYYEASREAASGLIPEALVNASAGLPLAYAKAKVEAETQAANGLLSKISNDMKEEEVLAIVRDMHRVADEIAGSGARTKMMGTKMGEGLANSIVSRGGDIAGALGSMGGLESMPQVRTILSDVLAGGSGEGFSANTIDAIQGEKGSPRFAQMAVAALESALLDPRISKLPEAQSTILGALDRALQLPGAQQDRAMAGVAHQMRSIMTMPDGTLGLNKDALKNVITSPLRTGQGLEMYLKEVDSIGKSQGVQLPIELYRKELTPLYQEEMEAIKPEALAQMRTEGALDAAEAYPGVVGDITSQVSRRIVYGNIISAQANLKAVAEMVPGNKAVTEALADLAEKAKVFQPAEPGNYNAWEDIMAFNQKLAQKQIENKNKAVADAEARAKSVNEKYQQEINNRFALEQARQMGPTPTGAPGPAPAPQAGPPAPTAYQGPPLDNNRWGTINQASQLNRPTGQTMPGPYNIPDMGAPNPNPLPAFPFDMGPPVAPVPMGDRGT